MARPVSCAVSPSGNEPIRSGGGIDLFQLWLDTGDMGAFWLWYACMTSGGGATQ
jgi:hypothetical protein